MIKVMACIFDLDGVIVDTAKYHYLAWKRLAEELGFNFTEQDNERLKGVSRIDSLNILLEIGKLKLTESEKATLAQKKNLWYVDYISELTPNNILPGVPEFLESVKAHQIKMAIGSASKNAGMILQRLGILDQFDAIVDGTKVSKAKPDPEVFLKGAKELGVEPSGCIVFEDAIAGVEAAINAKMHCVGVGHTDTLCKANYVIQSFINVNFIQLMSKLNDGIVQHFN